MAPDTLRSVDAPRGGPSPEMFAPPGPAPWAPPPPFPAHGFNLHANEPGDLGRGETGSRVVSGPNTRSARVVEPNLADFDRHTTIIMHLWPLFMVLPIGIFAAVIPLAIWLGRYRNSVFVDDHGREIMNAAISFTILNIGLAMTIVGAVLLPFLWVYGVVSFCRGAFAASRGEYFRYPLTFRFF